MATITDYFEQAQLSMAAYALGLYPGMSNLKKWGQIYFHVKKWGQIYFHGEVM